MDPKDHSPLSPDLDWRDGAVPVSRHFDDPYYSLENGLAETEYVFLAGNDLPRRFCDGFHIAELGFGTGLNFMTALKSWRDVGLNGCLHFTSFELYPMHTDDMARALAQFPELGPTAMPILKHWNTSGPSSLQGADFTLDLIIGDARKTLGQWQGAADAWFLDGFSPAKNPQLWEEALLIAVAEKTQKGGTCASYTAAGAVRRALQSGGFEIKRTQGFGRKRHMIQGVKPL